MPVNEEYHLQVQGERRGPYTLRQVDHMLNAGIIPPETLYLREEMEEWQPVTDVVTLRRPKSHLKRNVTLGILALLLAVAGHLFGPTVVDGWREAAQTEYTPRAAYWSARDSVRREGLPSGVVVKFGKFSHADVTLLLDDTSAEVTLSGEVMESGGNTYMAVWQVMLGFDTQEKQWHSREVKGQRR